MTNIVSLTFELNTNNKSSELGFEAWVDDTQFVDIDHVQDKHLIKIDLPDVDGEHELRLVLKNKTEKHTRVDDNNNILSDSTLSISDLAFDEIKLGFMLTKLSVYHHNFNGTGKPVEEKFYGEMGCNGTVSLKFTTPLYLWLLENM